VRALGIAALAAVALAAASAALGAAHGPSFPVTVAAPIAVLRLDLGLVPLAAPFCALLAVLDIAVACWSVRRGRAVDALLIAAFSAAMLLVLAARSVALFLFAWEAMALVSAFLVAAQHERRAVRRATFTYLAVSQAGALCLFVALALLARAAGDTSFDTIARTAPTLPADLRAAVLWLGLVGFGSKAGLVPLHFWLPRAHPVAPPHASALLSGAMLKVALYGLALLAFSLAAPAPPGWGIALVLVGTISALGGVLYALVDHDLKQLLAYHSVENVGIIAIGLGTAVVAADAGLRGVAALALVAALFHAINHGLFKALLFLGAGAVADAYKSVDLERLGGAWRALPWTAPLFLIGCASIVALPPFNGFASEWLTLQALVGALAADSPGGRLTAIAAIAGLALTGGLAAACFVKVFGAVFLGEPRRVAPPASVERFEVATVGPLLLAALCVLLGVAPALAIAPLGAIAGGVLGTPAPTAGALALTPALLALLPFAGAAAAFGVAARRGVRRVPTWTCGSPVGPQMQYTAAAFANPLRTVFARVFAYSIDGAARWLAALSLRLSRRSRAVQSGHLRLYLAYAFAAVIAIALAAR
jgi:formate hydrogenlyase subunit 3/multisubunit Na+/H+ antiporter MnhD subunit